METFVIVVTYKGKHWYKKCFDSVLSSNIPIHLIVIDNASNDGSAEYIKQYYPDIILIESDKNLGFGQANNIGIKFALNKHCDFVFLLNQDAWIEPDTISTLINAHSINSEYGIIAPIHTTPEKDRLEKSFLSITKDNIDPEFLNDLFWGNVKDIYETSYIHAAGWLLPAKTLQTVGGFDPIYKHYEEDDDYINRVIFHNLRIGICPKSRMVHDCERHGVPEKQVIEQRHNQMLLLEYTNPNVNKPIIKNAVKLIIQSISKLFCLKFQACKLLFHDAILLLAMKKRIKVSRATNKKKGMSWLWTFVEE